MRIRQRVALVRGARVDAPTEVAALPAWETPEGMTALREATAEHAALAAHHRGIGYASTPADYVPRHAAA
ncbi:hypothetical protein ACPXB5_11460 [Micromonospora arida]|uniref:hypothetical protein n=1 Tax=Micromonospora arida TaxID=2203715 RepID=UPI003CF2E287